MYLTVFKLKEAPFQADPDPRFLYLSKSHARAKAYMESAISTADDCVVITGEAGFGKTMLVETLRRELEPSVVVAHLPRAPVSAAELLQALLDQFGFIPFRGGKAALLSTLHGFLVEQRAAGRKALLIVDEAQDLGPPPLEEIRVLASAESGHESLLRIILVGQPGLSQNLGAPELSSLAQRARLRCHLAALTPEQTQGYFAHRLAIAGSQGREIFQSACHEIINRYTGGVPSLINSLCDGALRTAAAAGRDQVQPDDVQTAAQELQLQAVPAHAAADATPSAGRGKASRRRTTRLAKDLAGAPVARLRVTIAGQAVLEHQLHSGRMMIGRATDAELCIDDRTLSRHHCQIISNDQLSVLQDLNSTNGVYVADQRVRHYELRDGDVIALGAVQITYSDERGGKRPGSVGDATSAALPRMSEADGETTQN